MQSKWSTVTLLLFMSPILLMYQNCSKVGVADIAPVAALSQNENPGGSQSGGGVIPPTGGGLQGGGSEGGGGGIVVPPGDEPPCTGSGGAISEQSGPVKVLFLVDQSGSNVTPDDYYHAPATDPKKAWREKVINDFVGSYNTSAHPNFSFEIATFQGDSSKALIKDSHGNAIFTGSSSLVQNAISAFAAAKDGGYTPYQAAFNIATSAITYDLKTADAKTKYVIIMLTDGMPTDHQFENSNEQTNITNLQNAVKNVVQLSPQQISFNTFLYYQQPPVQKAQDYLSAMAAAGSGKYMMVPADPANDLQVLNDYTVWVAGTGPSCGG